MTKNYVTRDASKLLVKVLGELAMERKDFIKFRSLITLVLRRWTLPILLAIDELEEATRSQIYYVAMGYGISLNWNKLKGFLDELCERNILDKKQEGDKEYYSLSEKGKKLLEGYKEFVKTIVSLYEG